RSPIALPVMLPSAWVDCVGTLRRRLRPGHRRRPRSGAAQSSASELPTLVPANVVRLFLRAYQKTALFCRIPCHFSSRISIIGIGLCCLGSSGFLEHRRLTGASRVIPAVRPAPPG